MIELITGTPGSGKTTYAVAMRLVKEAARQITDETGSTFVRRLVTAGFRGLLVEHHRLPHKLTKETTSSELVEMFNAIEPGTVDTPLYNRLPGDPPLTQVRKARRVKVSEGWEWHLTDEFIDVEPMVENWWLWCMPGDFIAVDEAQFIMPRATLGRKPPVWIQKFEVHRHYATDWLLVTQHPQLLEVVVRNLVGLHRHVRSIMGSSVCAVYTWDHAANPERYNLANKAVWRRKAAHYRLFHSAVAHVKPPTSGRAIFVVLPVLIISTGFLFYRFSERWRSQPQQQQPVATAPGQPLSSPLGLSSLRPTGPIAAGGTALRAAAPVKDREPWAGFGVHLSGSWSEGEVTRSIWSLSIDGRVVATLAERDVHRAGYAWRLLAPCVGVLVYGDRERLVRCDSPSSIPQLSQQAPSQPFRVPSSTSRSASAPAA